MALTAYIRKGRKSQADDIIFYLSKLEKNINEIHSEMKKGNKDQAEINKVENGKLTEKNQLNQKLVL